MQAAAARAECPSRYPGRDRRHAIATRSQESGSLFILAGAAGSGWSEAEIEPVPLRAAEFRFSGLRPPPSCVFRRDARLECDSASLGRAVSPPVGRRAILQSIANPPPPRRGGNSR